MGVTITAKNSQYEFDMGYGGFYNLRKNIAYALDEEFGKNYALLGQCMTETQYQENDATANSIIEYKSLDSDIVKFLYMPDTEGRISYKVCKKIYEIIKDEDFGNKGFRYAAYSHNDYEEFKDFLCECFLKRKSMRWF